jgi:hypothetical protein
MIKIFKIITLLAVSLVIGMMINGTAITTKRTLDGKEVISRNPIPTTWLIIPRKSKLRRPSITTK